MQSVLSRIWTCVAVSISYDDNHYTTDTSIIIVIIIVPLYQNNCYIWLVGWLVGGFFLWHINFRRSFNAKSIFMSVIFSVWNLYANVPTIMGQKYYIYIYIYIYIFTNIFLIIIVVDSNNNNIREIIPAHHPRWVECLPLVCVIGCDIIKTLKIVLDTSLLNTHQYKVCIKGKVEQSRERSSALPYTSV